MATTAVGVIAALNGAWNNKNLAEANRFAADLAKFSAMTSGETYPFSFSEG